MAKSLKGAAVSGMMWSGFERIAIQGIQFVVGIFVARALMPEDYGIVGMLAIFLAIAGTLLDSGFGNALIQKKGRTEADYSTVFIFNVVAALLLYAVLFVSAPYIAAFYNMPILTDVARVVSLSMIISALSGIPYTKLTIDLNFRIQSISSIASVVLSGTVGIIMAYSGFGVWALVAQGLTSNTVGCIIVWCYSRWKPKLVFSAESFRSLFSFGSKLLCSSMINTIFGNLYTLVIGKFFSASSVGYFNRGNGYASLASDTITGIVLKVNYPILSELQDDNARLIHAYKKLLRTPMYILYPILAGMSAVGYPLIEVMIGAKWLPCVPIMQLLCFGSLWIPLTHINLNLLYVKGRSDLVLKLELMKKPIAFLILFASIPFGLLWMCAGRAFYSFIAFTFNCYYTKKILNYGQLEQLKELLPIFINSAVMFGVVTLVMSFIAPVGLKLVVGIVTGVASYILFSIFTRDESFFELKQIIVSKLKKSSNKGE